MRASDVVHPEVVRAVHAWHPDPAAALAEGVERALRACEQWRLTDVAPLRGGTESIVAAGALPLDRDAVRVVLKVPLRSPDEAALEATALRGFGRGGVSCVPEVIDEAEGVLLMAYVPGVAVHATDAGAAAEALLRLHSHEVRPELLDRPVPTWESRREDRFDFWARRVRDRGGILAPLVPEAEATLVDLLRAGQSRLLHADVQGKNLLRDQQVWAVDPIASTGPLASDIAHSLGAVVSAGGPAAPILQVARELDVPRGELRGWLLVAAIHHAGTSANVDNETAHRRLQEMLQSA